MLVMLKLPMQWQQIVFGLLLMFHRDFLIFAFNIEDRIPLIKVGPKNSLFGLSVAQHYMESTPTNLDEIVFLVGAPRANAGNVISINSSKSGALYKCTVLSNNHTCQQVLFDQGENSRENDISNQWLGVTVQSQKPGGKVAVCGHRYARRAFSARGVVWEELSGHCYQLDHSLDTNASPEVFSPCDGKDPDGRHSYEFYAYCQAGTSVAFAQNDEEDILIGAPGVFLWTGILATVHLNPNDSFFNEIVYSQSKKRGPVRLNSYLGFSSAVGNITGFNMIAGAPRANDTGSVVMYKKVGSDLQLSQIFHGERIASSYGYDVKVFDITGDGRDDLIVGAPQYYDRDRQIGGAVYIYVNKGFPMLGPDFTTVLYGELYSSFGTSITNLGDINMDGVNDIAIGAPGDNEGVGAVYVYHGSSDLTIAVQKTPAQILQGASVVTKNNVTIAGFGYSLSGGLDMDLNGYPDLTVGSLSDVVVLFRTRPIVNVKASIRPSVSKIDINSTTAPPKYVTTFTDSNTNKTYKLVTFNVSVCMQYSSSPSSFNESLSVNYTLALDAEKLDNLFRPRLTFVPRNYEEAIMNGNLMLARQSEEREVCNSMPVYLDSEMQDKLSPFVLSLSYGLVSPSPEIKSKGRLESLNKYPILNKVKPPTASARVNISKNCGEDEICHSNLTMKVRYMVLMHNKESWEPLEKNNNGIPVLMVGTEKGIGIQVNVTNPSPGEDAHQAKFKMLLPSFFRFSGIVPKTFVCEDDFENTSLAVCSIGNPFRTNAYLSMIIKLENDKVLYSQTDFTISMTISTSSVQEGLEFKDYTVAVRKQVALKIEGYTDNDQIPFGGKVIGESAVKAPADVGLPVIHSYEITNIGTTEVDHVIVFIDWPYAISNDKWLFYLLSVGRVVAGTVNESVCEATPDFLDPLHLSSSNKSRSARAKRDADPSPDNEPAESKKDDSSIPQASRAMLKCPVTAKCVKIVCNVGSIGSNKRAFITVKGVTWNGTFLEEFNGTTQVMVYSNASVQVNISNVEYADSSEQETEVLTTMLSEKIVVSTEPVAIWIILLACLCGVVLLVVIVVLLWKCGFFKRKRDYGDYHKARKHRQASKKADEVSDRLVY